MIAEIITIGTEILMGQILNTNAQYLTRRINELGINIYYQSTVGDNKVRMVEVIQQAFLRSDVVFLSGGLGPTEDDITKWAVADVLGVPLEEDEESKKILEAYFANASRHITKNNYRQVQFPKGAQILKNNHGTAPGCICEKNEKMIVVLPGPPHELKPMMENEVIPYLSQKSDRKIESKIVRLFGVGESAVEEEVIDLIHQTNPTVAPYASLGEVSLRVTASVQKNEDALQVIDPTVEEIKKRFGDYVYATDGHSLDEVVVNLLEKKKKTIAIAESITGGLLSAELIKHAGISQFFKEGIVCYSNEAKIRLGVPEEILRKYSAVSEETVKEMARAMRVRANVDFAIATTGVAGPSQDDGAHPIGTMIIGIACEQYVKSIPFHFTGNRARLRNVACLAGLNELRKALLAV